jgi:hypothetical protein
VHCALPPTLHAAYSRAAVRAELIGALLAAANPPVRSINIRLLTAEERALLDHAAAVLGAYSITFRQVGGCLPTARCGARVPAWPLRGFRVWPDRQPCCTCVPSAP